MKNYKIIYLLFVLASLLTACEDFLAKDPQQSLDAGSQFDSEEKLQTALAGTYNAIQDTDLLGMNLTLFPDLIADNADWFGSFPTIVDVTNQEPDAQNGEVAGLWIDGYTGINAANTVIESANTLAGIDPAVKDQLIGESLFIRGLIEFEQVRYFGKPFGGSSSTDLAVPLRTEAVFTLSEYENKPRNTVDEVYNQAISDLTTASTLLPDFVGNGRANRFAALAVLARIRFQRREYTEAATLALQVINGGFTLNTRSVTFYIVEFSGESIFELANTTQDRSGITFWTHRLRRDADTRIGSDLVNNGYNMIVTAGQQATISGAGNTFVDQRVYDLTEDGSGNLGGLVHPLKYEDNVNAADNSYIIRLAEFMLMRAEAQVINVGINQESIDLLNAVRLRAIDVLDGGGNPIDGTPFVAFVSGDFVDAAALQEAIILERRVELFLEGNRLHDLVRLNRLVKGTAPGADQLVWPVPQRAIDTNPLLIQNPGY